VKSSKAPAGQNRDRAYWEPPRAGIARLEGHVEEISLDEQASAPPNRRSGRIRALLEDRRAQAGLLGLCVVLIVGLLTVGPLATASSATPSPSPADSAAASDGVPGALDTTAPASAELSPSIESPGAQPTWSPIAIWTWPPTPKPTPVSGPSYSTKGWPIELEDNGIYVSNTELSPDGTLFVDGFPGFDRLGHARSGWLAADGSHVVPEVFGSDGTSYGIAYSDDQNNLDAPDHLYAFDSSGKVRAGWPVEIEGGATIDAGPSGIVYVFENDYAGLTTVTVYSPQAKKVAGWSFADEGGDCGEIIRPDGTLYFEYGPSGAGSDCAIRVFGPTGALLSPAPVRGWNGIEQAPDGSIVAWGYDLQPYAANTIAQTRVALIGTDGLPAAGWPVTIEGGASKPSFGADGTMYMTVLGLGTEPSRIVAIDPTGAPRAGWPVALPTGYGPMLDDENDPLPPVIGDNGTVYAAAVDRNLMGYVTAFDSTGATVPGWPYQLPQAFGPFDDGSQAPPPNPGPVFVRGASGAGLLYVVLDDRVVALQADGTVAPGWPYVLPGGYADATWATVMGTPDGGLVAMAGVPPADPDVDASGLMVAFRWTSAGTAPR
jgi:hypothetical protein